MEILKNEIERIGYCLLIAMAVTLIGEDHGIQRLLINFGFAIGGSLIGSWLARSDF